MPAKVTKVACQSCGANLNIDESIRFVTCGYCDAQLEIVHDSSTIHSKILEDVIKRQDAVEEELRILRLEKQLQNLEREWENFRSRVGSRDNNGTLVEPNRLSPILFGTFGMVIGLILVVASVQTNEWMLPLLLGVGVIATTFAISRHGIRRADEFASMRTRYLRKRTKLKGELAGAERDHRMPPMKRSGSPRRRS